MCVHLVYIYIYVCIYIYIYKAMEFMFTVNVGVYKDSWCVHKVDVYREEYL